MKAACSQSGFSLLELAISTAILITLGASLTVTLNSVKDISQTETAIEKMGSMGTRALTRMINDFKRSGFITSPNAYPYLFDDGNATGAYAAHWHAPAQHQAVAGDPDFGTTREVVFVSYQDADADQIPDTDASGNLVWDTTNTFSYVLVTDAKGVNKIERRVNGGSPETIASYVERLTIDSNATDITLPLDSLRIRIFFRYPNPKGGDPFTDSVESLIKLRNS